MTERSATEADEGREDDIGELAARVLARAAARGLTLGVAESLTGGAVAAALVEQPGASAVLRLGVVAYDTAMKRDVLGVDGALLEERGAVDPEVAVQMARGVRRLAATEDGACTFGLGTTGVAGPDGQDGHAPGEFHVGLELLANEGVDTMRRSCVVHGDRDHVRREACRVALALLDEALDRSDLPMHSQPSVR